MAHGTPVTLDPITLMDHQQVTCGVSPVKADGTPDTDAVFTFESSNPDELPVEVDAGGQSCTVKTPGSFLGSYTVTAKSSRYANSVYPIVREHPALGSANPSFGAPTDDAGD